MMALSPDCATVLSEAATNAVKNSHPYLAAAHCVRDGMVRTYDVLALPTYREGFPTVVLEANAAGKPVVAAAATGVVDAVVNNVTGMLVPVGDEVALASALELLLQDRRRAASLGAAGRERVLREYRQERAWDALEREYSRLLEVKGLSAPIERSETAAGWTTATASR